MKKPLCILNVAMFCLVFVAWSHQSLAQDPVFSQYYANKLYLNPAYTGFESGTTVNASYRNQWYKIAGKNSKFVTNSVGLNMEVPRFQSALGFLYVDNIEGEGQLRWQSIGASYAWRNRVCKQAKNETLELSLGLKTSYNWYSINWDNFVFSDQLDRFDGNVRPTQFSGAVDPNAMPSYFDLDFGVLADVNINKANTFRLGFVVNHLVRVDNSILQLDDTVSQRYTFHAAWVHGQAYGPTARNTYELIPMIKVEVQKASRSGQAVTYTLVDYGLAFSSRQIPGIFGGLWHRSQYGWPDQENINSLILLLGCEFGNSEKLDKADYTYRLGLSYDYNYSGIRSDGGGVFELSLIINLPNNSILSCNSRRKIGRRCPKF